MRSPTNTRLGMRLAVAVSLGLLLFGLGLGAVTFTQEYDRALVNSADTQRKMVRTVQVQAEIAAFTANELIATDVIDGLMADDTIDGVAIIGNEGTRFERSKPGANGSGNVEEHPLFSPADRKTPVGTLRVVTNGSVVRDLAISGARRAAALLMLQVLVAAAILGTVFHRVVGLPLHKLATAIGGVSPGSAERIPVDAEHDKDEIGFLARRTNTLLDAVERSLDEERTLRRRSEIDQRKYQDLFDNAGSGIFIAHADGTLLSWNRAFAELTWLEAANEARPRLGEHIVWHAPERVDGLLALALADSTGGKTQDELLLIGPRGDERWLHLVMVPLGDGSVQGTAGDVTERKREELAARKAAVTDPLTRLVNRAGLYRAMVDLDPRDPPFALAVLDLAGFRQINEAFNYAVGDQVLVAIADVLRSNARVPDTVARVGADVFAVIMAGEDDAAKIAQRVETIRARLTRPIDVSAAGPAQPISVEVSFGIAQFPQHGLQIEDLLRNAELALYAARQDAAGCWRFYDPGMQAAVEHRRRLEDDLRTSIAARGLELHFQPIVDLAAGRLSGAEALLRWIGSERGFVPPDIFIPLAEELGLIGDLGLFVLEEACRNVAQWRADGLPLYVSVNVSAQQIPAKLSPAHVAEALTRYQLPADALVLEITEGVLMSDVAAAKQWLETIRSTGVRVFLDDFGTGYSSLSYLKRFPMDAVKIDKSFVRDLTSGHSDRALVDAIITMARSLGLKVVAEGIEDESQLAILRQMTCAFGQGYHFSRPVAAADFQKAAQRINADLSPAQAA